jgi:hypothetical protein
MSRKRTGVEIRVTAGLLAVLAGACAHNPYDDPPPSRLGYEQAIACAGLFSALHQLGEPEGWTYDRRADMFAIWAEELAPHDAGDLVAPAVRAVALRHLSQFPDLKLTESIDVLEPLQERLREANSESVWDCEGLSPAFDIIIVAGASS